VSALRRDACPTLVAPMASGDGLLARLAPESLTPDQLARLARAAVRFGNGVMEITARGSLQIRGFRAETAPSFAAEVEALGLAPLAGPPVLTGALAGVDPGEIADPRPLASVLRGFAGPLRPKVSAIADGGGALHLDALAADLRLRATPEGWLLAAGGTAGTARGLGVFDAEGAAAAALDLLDVLSRAGARARDLDLGKLVRPGVAMPPMRPPVLALGRFRLRRGLARAVAAPFGHAASGAFEALAVVAGDATELRLAPGGALVALGLDPVADDRLRTAAARLGFVTEPGDPRLGVVACPGAPACHAGLLPTRAMAGAIAAAGVTPSGARLHLSGCPKRCAQPFGPAITLVATPDGPLVTGEGVPVPDDLRACLLAQAEAASS
jgi:precorrin-3B synthase